jgi:hypothetical protein
VTEGQADARTALRRVFSVLRSLVRMHAVHPASISLETHYKKRVVRKRDALRRALHTGGGTTITVVITLLVSSSVGVGTSILLRPKRHSAPSAKGEVHNARAAHDVDRLVRVFRDVVRARAVELDKHVIYRVLQRVLDVCTDGGYCGREGEQRGRFIGRVAVDWVAFVVYARERVLALSGQERGGETYLPLASISPCTATSRGTSPPVGDVVSSRAIGMIGRGRPTNLDDA